MTKMIQRLGLTTPLLASAVLLSMSGSMMGQTSTKKSTMTASEDFINAPRFELGVFGGIQTWRLNQDHTNNPNYLEEGGAFGARFDADLTKHFGLEVQWTFWAENNLQLGVSAGSPVGIQSAPAGSRNGQVYAGPVLYLTKPQSKFRPFVTVGPAYQYFWVTSNARTQAQSTALPYSYFHLNQLDNSDGPALVYGLGFKYNISKHIALRADGRGIFTRNPHFNLPGLSTGLGSVYIQPGGTQNGMQVNVGVGYRFGYRPEVVVAVEKVKEVEKVVIRDFNTSLSASPAEVCAGESVTVTATSSITGATLAWMVNGSAVSGTTSYQFTPTATTTVSVTARNPGYNDSTATTTVTVKPYVAPNGSVTANPSSLTVGQSSQLASNFNGQCGGTIKAATYTVSEGSVNGSTFDSSSVQFDAANTDEQTKSVTVTATASDNKGSGTATTTITVRKPASAKASRLPDLIFSANSSRVNNCGKRLLLEQLKTYLDKDPTGKVVFVGHNTDREKVKGLDQQRALNAAAVISGGKGICLNFAPTQILIDAEGTKQNGVDFQPFFCGTSTTPKTAERGGSMVNASDKTAQYRRVEVYFVPTNAQLPASVTNYKDATTYNVGKMGCPK